MDQRTPDRVKNHRCLARSRASDYAALVMFFSTTTFKLGVRAMPPYSGRAKPVDTVRPLRYGVPAFAPSLSLAPRYVPKRDCPFHRTTLVCKD